MAKGSNDLNLLLKSQVVKIRAELDIPKSMPTIRKQVKEISDRLDKENKRVKIKVELNATMTELRGQIREIQKRLTESKTVKPISIKVDIDVAGSAKKIKEQLKDVYETVNKFNKQYAQQMKQAQQQMQNMFSGAQQPVINPIIGFDYKLYAKQVKEAEQMMRQTFGKKGVFSSFEFRDASGNLQGFVAQLEKANGVVQKVKYEWNKEAGTFTPINQQTINTMQKHVDKAEQMLKGLQKDLFALQDGSGKNNLLKQYDELEKRISSGSLTQKAVQDLQRQISEEKALERQIDKTNKEYVERQNLMREIRNLRTKAMEKDPQSDISQYNQLLRAVKSGTASVAEQRLEYKKLNDELAKQVRNEKEVQANTKKRLQTLQQLRTIERQTVSSDETSQNLIREIKHLAQRAKHGKEWIDIQHKMNLLNTSNANAESLRRIEVLQDKVNKKVREYGSIVNLSEREVIGLQNSIEATARRGEKDLERMFYTWKKNVEEVKARQKELRRESEKLVLTETQSNKGVSYGDVTKAVARMDTNELKRYMESIYGARVETVKLSQTSDSLGRTVDRLKVTMAGKGKTVKAYTLDLDRLNKVLRQTESAEEYNANRNLGVIEQLKIAMARIPVWMTGMTAFYGTINGFRAMANEILEVDKALTELRRVASEGINIDHVFENAVKLAGELGNNVHDVMQTMNDFARTFGDFNERQLTAITRTATLMSNVSELTTIEAGETLIGTMNAFNITAEESIRIVDAFNEVDNNFAVSTKQLAEGMSKTASTAKTFGVEMEDVIGHITAISSVTMESGKVIGNSLKTIYSRITTLNDAKEVLEGAGVALYDIQGNVLSVDRILGDLANKWDTLSDSERQNIAVKVAGRYQLSRFLALMNSWDTAIEATETAILSQGSAMRENNEYMKSFESRINALKTSFTELSLSVGEAFMSGAMLAGIEALASLAKGATMVAQEFGALPVILGVLGFVMRSFGLFKGSISGLGYTLRILQLEFTRTAVGSTMMSRALAGTKGVTDMLRGSLIGATTAVAGLGTAIKGFLASTVIGLVFVGIGLALETAIKKWNEHKEAVEANEKAMKTLVDSYRNTSFTDSRGNTGLNALIDEWERLDSLVNKGVIQQGTEEYNEYLRVNQQLAESMPTMVKYVDSQGKAHLMTADAMREEYKIAEQLSLEYAELTKIEFDSNISKRIDSMKKLAKEMDELAKKQEKLRKEDGTTKYVYSGAGYGVTHMEVDNTKAIQQTKIEMVQFYQQMQQEIQAINLQIREAIRASLEADGLLKNMTESQIATVETFAIQNEKYLMELVTMLQAGDITQQEFSDMMKERSNELLLAGEELAKAINSAQDKLIEDAVSKIDKNIEDYDRKVADVTGKTKEQFDMLLKSLPKEFFTEDMIHNTDLFGEKLNKVISVADQIKDGKFEFNELVSTLEKQGFTAEQARAVIFKLGKEYDSASIKAEFLRLKEEGLIEGLEGYIEAGLEAVDVTKEIFGYDNETLNSLKTNIDLLQQLEYRYGETAKETDQWKNAIKEVSWFLGIEEEQIASNLGYYFTVAELIPKLTLDRDEYGNVIGYNKDQLNEYEKSIIREMEASGKEGEILDILTGKRRSLTDEISEQKEATEEVIITTEKEVEMIEEATNKFNTYKEAMNDSSRSTYLDTIDEQLDDYVGKVEVVKGENEELKLQMSDGSESQFLNTIQEQLKDMGLTIEDVVEDGESLKLTLKDEDGKEYFMDIAKGKVSDMKEEVKDTKKEVEDFNTMLLDETSLNLNTWNLSSLVTDLDKIKKNIESLDDELKNTLQNTIDVKDEIGKVVDQFANISTTMDTIINNVPSLQPFEDKVVGILGVLLEIQNQMGAMFNGLATEVGKLNTPLDNVKSKIEEVGQTFAGFGGLTTAGIIAELQKLDGQTIVTTTNVNKLGQALAGVGGLTTGNLGGFVTELAILSHNLVLVSQYGEQAVRVQREIKNSMELASTAVKDYNQAINNTSTGVGNAYKNMSASIVSLTNEIISAYNRNIKTVQELAIITSSAMARVASEMRNSSRVVITLTTDMSKEMHKVFKDGTDKIVKDAEKMPERIAKGIKANQSKAINAVKSLLNEISSVAEKGLNNTIIKGINSVLSFMGVDKGKHIPNVSIPQYAKGTNDGEHAGGLAIVGEEGRELAYIPNKGYAMLGTSGKSELVNLPKGTSVLPNKETEELLKSYGFPAYADGIGTWFSEHFTEPSKLMAKVWGAGINFAMPKGAVGELALSGIDTVKEEAINYVSEQMSSMFGFFGDVSSLFGNPFRMTSKFGMRWGRMHNGYDFGAPYGTPIPATTGGQVIFSGWNNGGFGNLVMVRDAQGLVHYYAHNSKNLVKAGDMVSKGTILGLVGSTGHSFGNHVHYEIRRNGQPIDYGVEMFGLPQGAMNVGSGVQRWEGVARQALIMTGQFTPANLQRLLYQMKTESGGNPYAINLWDSNAKRGTPSKGLMQVIDPTFRSYALPPYNKNIYDPLSNILASIRYALSRYGSLARAYRGVGYEKGGFIDHEHMAMVGEKNKREVVIPLEQYRDRAISLWTQAGQELGLVEKKKRSRGGIGALGGAFGASSGEGGGESGSGGTGSSGILVPSIYDNANNVARVLQDGYDSYGGMAELYNVDNANRIRTQLSGRIAQLEGRMERLNKLSKQYRDYIQEIIDLKGEILEKDREEFEQLNKRYKEVEKRLQELGEVWKHNEAEREEYNKLQQEFENIINRMSSLKGSIESTFNEIRNKTMEMFKDVVDDIIAEFERGIKAIERRISDLDFRMQVIEITDPENQEAILDLMAERVRELNRQRSYYEYYSKELEDDLFTATQKFGKDSEIVMTLRERLEGMKDSWKNVTLEILRAEKEIRDARKATADSIIDSVKKQYEFVKSKAVEAKNAEIEEARKAHEAKIKYLDDEMKRIREVYDEYFKNRERDKSEEEYQEELGKKTERRLELLNKISVLSRDDSLEGRNRLKETQKELKELEKEIDNFMKERQETVLRQTMEDQRDRQIEILESEKETSEESYKILEEELSEERKAIEEHYDNIINDEKKWASVREELMKGNFSVLKAELEEMGIEIAQHNDGIFDNLSENFKKYSEEVQNFVNSINKMIDDMNDLNDFDLDGKVDSGRATKPEEIRHLIHKAYNDIPLDDPTHNKQYLYDLIQMSNVPRDRMDEIWRKAQNGIELDLPTPEQQFFYDIFREILKGASSFDTGGYTGDWAGNNAKVALVHKKELVLNENQTKDIISVAKIVEKVKDFIPTFTANSLAKDFAKSGGNVINNNVTYGDIYLSVHNSDKKKAKDIATELLNGLKKKGK